MNLAQVILALGVFVTGPAGAAQAASGQPLTGQPGDPRKGREVVLDRDRGHCLLCHRIAQVDEGFQGTIGPPLSDVGRRLDAARLRERLVDPTRLNPDTVMPAYYRVDDLRQVAEAFEGEPILTAQEIEDVVAYLQTLTQLAVDMKESTH